MASCLKTKKKLTNQPTIMSKLKSGQPCNVICEITGHARESSLDDNDEMDKNQRKELSHIISEFKEVPNENSSNDVSNQTVRLQRHPFYRHSNSQSYTNKHHWFLLITSNTKVECARPWHWILIFRQLVLHDFHQVVPHSFSTAWQRLPVVLLHRRFTPAVLSFFPPRKRDASATTAEEAKGLYYWVRRRGLNFEEDYFCSNKTLELLKRLHKWSFCAPMSFL